jgi:hypothetical protein
VPLLTQAHRQAMLQIVESGPIPAVHGVVRWRLIDLAQWVFDEFRISIGKQTLIIRVCPKSQDRGEAAEHELDHGEIDERSGGSREVFEIAGQSAVAADPGEGALDDPAFGLEDEALGGIGALDDRDAPRRSDRDLVGDAALTPAVPNRTVPNRMLATPDPVVRPFRFRDASNLTLKVHDDGTCWSRARTL